MVYKSILTVWDGNISSRAAFSHAIALTQKSNGHLHILCPAYITLRSVSAYPFAAFPVEIPAQERETVTLKAETLKTEVAEMLEDSGIEWSVETVIINRDQVPAMMQKNARYADITVLPRPYGPSRNETDEHIAEGALFSNTSPVLIVPNTIGEKPTSSVLIAWDGSDPSLHAIQAALPILNHAETINVVIFAKNKKGKKPANLATDISIWMARHGLDATIKISSRDTTPIGGQILKKAKKRGADLIVMGGYGHSPLRELLFGGVTRDTLKASTVSVLMAH
jgi:nucleotide-binding universal stress UspA family protein